MPAISPLFSKIPRSIIHIHSHRTALSPRPSHPFLIPRSSLQVAMSTATPKQEFLIILPDAPGKLPDRMAVRPQHLEVAKSSAAIVMGGATLDEHPNVEGEPLKINGSAMLVVAGSREEAMELIRGDIYSKSGVWDLDKIQIYPFKSALRKGL